MQRALIASAAILVSAGLLTPVQVASADVVGLTAGGAETGITSHAAKPKPKPAPKKKPAPAPKPDKKNPKKPAVDVSDTTEYGAISDTLAGAGTSSLGGGAVASLIPALGTIAAPISLVSGSISLGIGVAASQAKNPEDILKNANNKK